MRQRKALLPVLSRPRSRAHHQKSEIKLDFDFKLDSPLDWLKTKINKNNENFNLNPRPEYEPDQNVVGIMKDLNFN